MYRKAQNLPDQNHLRDLRRFAVDLSRIPG